MNRLLKFSGLLLWISITIFGIYYLYINFTEVSDSLFKWFGITCLIILVGYVLIRLIFGKKWIIEAPKSFFIGSDLIKATENTLNELPSPTKSTLATLIGHIVYRFTRIGIFAFLVALVPIGILSIQTILLSRQNDKLDQQNIRLDQQTSLLEADRRAAVILESGNVFDAVARELEFKKPQGDSSLSDPLIGRIIALSRAMKEYKYLDPHADTLIGWPASPERGHLIVFLYNSRLDSSTYRKINNGGNFLFAELFGTNIEGINLENTDLEAADFRYAGLDNASLRDAYLGNSNFSNASLKCANLENAFLRYVNFKEVELEGANLKNSNLDYSNLQDSYLTNADFSNAILHNVQLQGADLEQANLTGAMAFKSQIQSFLLAGADTTGMVWMNDPK